MPQLIFFALVGAVAYFGYRAFLREAETHAAGTLIKDPETGEYRPARD